MTTRLAGDQLDWPEQTVDEPSLEEIEAYLFEGKEVPATDGCLVWFTEVCPHGHPAWTLRLGYDPVNYGITVVDL